MSHNVVIKRRMASFNVDAYNTTAIHTADLDNGSVFVLDEKVIGNQGVWKVTAPTATSTHLWIATSPEVIYADKNHGESVDPRDFCNVAGKAIDATFLNVMDLVEMTGEGITGIATATYLTNGTGFTLVASSAVPTQGIVLKKIDEDTLKVGDGAIAPATIPTYLFRVEKN